MPQMHRQTQEDDLLDGKYSGKKILSILRADCGTRLHPRTLFAWVYGQRRIILVLSCFNQTEVSRPAACAKTLLRHSWRDTSLHGSVMPLRNLQTDNHSCHHIQRNVEEERTVRIALQSSVKY